MSTLIAFVLVIYVLMNISKDKQADKRIKESCSKREAERERIRAELTDSKLQEELLIKGYSISDTMPLDLEMSKHGKLSRGNLILGEFHPTSEKEVKMLIQIDKNLERTSNYRIRYAYPYEPYIYMSEFYDYYPNFFKIYCGIPGRFYIEGLSLYENPTHK